MADSERTSGDEVAPTPDPTFNRDLAAATDHVFRENSGDLTDHRAEFPWLTGCLGDPKAPVWFVAEVPSLTQIERVRLPSVESQWSQSRGDKLFRRMLVNHGFKDGTEDSPGGWRCYITNVVKSTARAGEWRSLKLAYRFRVSEMWAPVLRFELEYGQPRVVVALGAEAARYLDALTNAQLIPSLRVVKQIPHYTYVASRPTRDGRPPSDPSRIEEWSREFASVRGFVQRG